MAKITPHLWYSSAAEEAANFYASIFPDSRVDRVTALPNESPSGPLSNRRVSENAVWTDAGCRARLGAW